MWQGAAGKRLCEPLQSILLSLDLISVGDEESSEDLNRK